MDRFAPGTVLKGTYKVLQTVGEGGAGIVYAAEHTSLGHLVAVKTLFPKLARHPDMRSRFLEEGIIQANLNHPNIARVTDTINESGVTAIVMEYIDGSSMDGFLRKLKEPPSIETVVKLFVPILDAMYFAHEQGVVHRDLKPGNILLANVGGGVQPRVTDFGIAKVVSNHSRTATGTTMGTLYYIAPEQLSNAKGVDHRADIYSLGVTLFELLTLRVPFEAESDYAIMRAHIETPPPDPRTFRSDLPQELVEVLRRSLAKKPDDRFASCREFKEELMKAVGASPLAFGSGSVELPALGAAARRPQGMHTAPQPPGDSSPSGMDRMPRTGTPQPSRVGAESPSSASRGIGGSTRLANGPSSSPRGAATIPDQQSGSGMRAMPNTAPPSRTAGPRTGPRSTSAPAPAAGGATPVQKIIWGVIAALAVGLVLIVAFRPSRNPAPAPAAAPAAPPTPAPAPAVAGSADVGSDSEGSSGQPSEADRLLLQTCRGLAQTSIEEPPPPHEVRIATISTLEERLNDCPPVMVRAAQDSRYDSLLANLNADHLRMVLHYFKAAEARDANTDPCTSVLIAATEAQRSLQRIREAVATDQLMDYEKVSISPRRQKLAAFHRRLQLDYTTCPISAVPRDLLMLSGDGAPPDGSGQPGADGAPAEPAGGSGAPP
jgi:serine/threonine protein kinase